MSADDDNLFRIFRPANVANNVGGIDRAVGDFILDVDLQARGFAAIEIPFELFLIFGRHADHRNVVVSVESERAGVGQVHAGGFAAALAADHRDGAGGVGRFQEVAEFGEG